MDVLTHTFYKHARVRIHTDMFTHTSVFLLRIWKNLDLYHPQIWGYEKVGSHIDFTLLPRPAGRPAASWHMVNGVCK